MNVFARTRAFFEAERQRPTWRGPGIIATMASVSLLGNLVLVARTPAGDQPVVAFATRSGAIEAPAFTLLGVLLSFGIGFVFWLLYAGIAHAITAQFGGRGSFARYATLFAWGVLPGLVFQVLWVAVLVTNAMTSTPPVDSAATEAWIEGVMSGPAMTVLDVVYPVVMVGSFGLWVVATVVGRRVTTRQATLAVLPCLLIEVGLYYVSVLQ